MKKCTFCLLALILSFLSFNSNAQCAHNVVIEVLEEPFCPGTFIGGQLQANVFNGSGSFTYSWLDSQGNNPIGGPQTSAATLEYLEVNEEYTVYVTDTQDGCISSAVYTFTDYICVSDTTSILTESTFDINPVDYGVYSQCELKIVNHGCEINLKPQFIISHDSPIQQGDLTIEYLNASSVWEAIPYSIDGSGDALGYWGDDNGELVNCDAFQSRPVRIKFNQYNPEANLGQYTAMLRLWKIDDFGTLSSIISENHFISVVLQDTICQNIGIMSEITDASCPNTSDGEIQLVSSGGASPYLYSINNSPFTDASLYSSLDTGVYDVLMKDSNNCQINETLTVGPPSLLPNTITFSGTNNTSTTINWEPDALADGYRFRYKLTSEAWSVGTVVASGSYTNGIAELFTSKQLINLNEGSDYEVQVKVNSLTSCEEGWSSSYFFSTTEYSYDFNIDSTCVGLTDGQILLDFESQSNGFQFNWSGPLNFTSTDTSISNLTAGNYTLIITNPIAEVVLDTIIVISEFPSQIIPLTIEGNPFIISEFNGIFFASICQENQHIEGADGYSNYIWNNSFVGQDLLLDTTTVVYLNATDQYGCLATSDTINVTVVSDFILLTENNQNEEYIKDTYRFCSNDNPIVIDVSPFYSGNFSVKWYRVDGQTPVLLSTTSVLEFLPTESSNYQLEIFSCNFEFFVDFAISPSLDFNVVDDNFCIEDDFPYSVSFEIETPVPSFYSLNNDSALITSGTTEGLVDTIFDIDIGSYNFLLSDMLFCTIEDSFEILLPDTIFLDSIQLDDPVCFDDLGSFSYIITGGVSPYNIYLDGVLITSAYPDSTIYTLQNLSAADYLIQIEDFNNCFASFEFEITQPDSVKLDTVQVQNVLCFGDSTASILVEVNGGIPDYNYDLFLDDELVLNQDTILFDSLFVGNYTITVYDQNDCDVSVGVEITQNNELIALENIEDHIDITCGGENSGAFSLLVDGGVAPYTVNIFGEESFDYPHVFDSLYADSILVEAYDSFGCNVQTTIIITQSDSLFIDFVEVINPICFNDSGSFNFTVSGENTPFIFTLNDSVIFPAFDETTLIYSLNNLIADVYLLEVQDTNDCYGSHNFEILDTVPEVEISLVSQDNVDCFGDSTASFLINAIGGSESFTFSLYLDGNLQVIHDNILFEDLFEANYLVIAQDENGCLDSLDVFITQSEELVFSEDSISHLDLECFGGQNGAFSFNVEGGTPSYSLNILDSASFDYPHLFTNLPSDTYTVEVFDSLNCTKQIDVFLSQPDSFFFDQLDWTEIVCIGAQDGVISHNVVGGTAPYIYYLNGDSLSPLDSLFAGIYTLGVIDANGCLIDSTFEIAEDEDFTISVSEDSSNHVSCFEGNDGVIVVEVNGPVSNYNFSINDSELQLSNEFSDLPGDTFSITVVNPLECKRQLEYIIETPLVNFSYDDYVISDTAGYCTLCYGDSSGTITVSFLGGVNTAMNDYYLNDIPNTDINSPFFEDLVGSEDYFIYAIDTLGCYSDTIVFECSSPDLLSVEPIVDLPTCCNTCDGKVTLLAVGGVVPYQYSIDDDSPQLLNQFSDTCGVDFCFTVVDENSCQVQVCDIDLSLPDCLVLDTINVNDPLSDAVINYDECKNFNTGEIFLDATGGYGGYTYSIQDQEFQTDFHFDNLSSGDYSIYVKDNMNCIDSIFATILPADPLTVTDLFTDTIYCDFPGLIFSSNSADLGGFNLDVTGGTANYSYSLDQDSLNFQTSSEFTNLPEGLYSVNIVDNLDCVLEYDLSIVSHSIDLEYTVSDISCFEYNDGIIQFMAFSDIFTPSFEVDGNSADSIYYGLSAGSHTLISYYPILDQQNETCIYEQTFDVQQPDELYFDYVTDNSSCNDFCDGSILISSIYGGASPYSTYCINLSDSSTYFEDLCGGSYAVTVSDSNGCVAFEDIPILEPSPIYPIINFVNGTLVVVDPTNDNPSSGTPPYSYQWYNDDELVPGENFETYGADLKPGSYYVLINDSNNCQSFSSSYIFNSTGLDSDLNFEIQVYPNPVMSMLFVKTSSNESLNWSLSDSQGRSLISGIGSDLLEIDFKNYENGVYFLSIYQMENVLIHKIVKQAL